jgi:hypothetical protein
MLVVESGGLTMFARIGVLAHVHDAEIEIGEGPVQ